jgi:hypothetical protein
MSNRSDQSILQQQGHLNNETDIMMQQHEHLQQLLQHQLLDHGQQSLNYEYPGQNQNHPLNLSSQNLRDLQQSQINILGHSSDSYESSQHMSGMGQTHYDPGLNYIHDQYSA